MTVSSAKATEPIVMLFGTRVQGSKEPRIRWGPDPHTQRGNFQGENGPAEGMLGHFQRLTCSKRLCRGAPMPIRVHIGATWRIQLNRPCAAAMHLISNYF